MDSLKLLLQDMIFSEPAASLWLAVSIAVLFGAAYAGRHEDQAQSRTWGRRLGEALVKSLVFVGIVWTFSLLITADYSSFSRIYSSFTSEGSLSRAGWKKWRASYGGRLVQRDLGVTQYVKTEILEVIPPIDPAAPPLYRNAVVEQPLEQNSIVGFRGHVTINLVDRAHQLDAFNAYVLSATYEYDVLNPADADTHARFSFPLLQEANLYQDVRLEVDDREIPWRIEAGSIVWDEKMHPGQKSIVAISYNVRGMDGFVYEVSAQREVMDFVLVVALDTEEC
jgi:hypothetical protein